MDKIEEAKRKAEEAAKAMKESFQRMFDGLGDKISRIRIGGEGRIEQGSYNTSRIEKDITREQKAQIAKIRSEGIDRRSEMTSEEEKALDLAEEELKIQQLITKNIKEQSDLKVKNATNTYNAKVSTHEASVKQVNEAIETYLSKVEEIDKKIDEQQKKIADAEKYNASPDRIQTVSTSAGAYTIDTKIDTKPMLEEIKKLSAQKEELDSIKQKAVDKIDLAKSEKEVQRALDAVIDANKDRAAAAEESALAEKRAASKVKEAADKMKATGWNNGKGEGVNDPSKFGEEENKKIEDQKRKALLEEQANVTKEGNRRQKELNDKLAQARNALQDWIDNLTSGAGNNFGDWNQQQNQNEKGKVPVMGQNGQPVMGANGQPIMIDKKQENAVKANRIPFDRILNKYDKDGDGEISDKEMKKMDERTKKEYRRRKSFDDQFNPKNIEKRQKEVKDLEKEKAEAEKQMQKDIKEINEKLKNVGL